MGQNWVVVLRLLSAWHSGNDAGDCQSLRAAGVHPQVEAQSLSLPSVPHPAAFFGKEAEGCCGPRANARLFAVSADTRTCPEPEPPCFLGYSGKAQAPASSECSLRCRTPSIGVLRVACWCALCGRKGVITVLREVSVLLPMHRSVTEATQGILKGDLGRTYRPGEQPCQLTTRLVHCRKSGDKHLTQTVRNQPAST